MRSQKAMEGGRNMMDGMMGGMMHGWMWLVLLLLIAIGIGVGVLVFRGRAPKT
jgi:hypothetical protein